MPEIIKFYKAAHETALASLDVTSNADLELLIATKFKEAGYSAQQDFEMFRTFAGDERIKLLNLSKRLLPSEMAAKKVV